MKKSTILFLSVSIALSSLTIAAYSRSVDFTPKSFTAQNEFRNIFRPFGNWFKRIFGKKYKNPYDSPNNPARIEDVILSVSEITKGCTSQKSIQNKPCSDVIQKIEVYTIAKDDENDVLVYYYKVSGGEVIGRDSKVIWDLSDVKPGVYTITVGVDDGAGFEGRTVTKEVKVVECPNCN